MTHCFPLLPTTESFIVEKHLGNKLHGTERKTRVLFPVAHDPFPWQMEVLILKCSWCTLFIPDKMISEVTDQAVETL